MKCYDQFPISLWSFPSSITSDVRCRNLVGTYFTIEARSTRFCYCQSWWDFIKHLPISLLWAACFLPTRYPKTAAESYWKRFSPLVSNDAKVISMTVQFSRTPTSLTMKSMWHFVLETGIQDKVLSWESLTFGIQMRNSVDSLVNNHITIDPVEAKNLFCEIKKRRNENPFLKASWFLGGYFLPGGQTLPLPLQSSLLKISRVVILSKSKTSMVPCAFQWIPIGNGQSSRADLLHLLKVQHSFQFLAHVITT